jgi:hypothetical protein
MLSYTVTSFKAQNDPTDLGTLDAGEAFIEAVIKAGKKDEAVNTAQESIKEIEVLKSLAARSSKSVCPSSKPCWKRRGSVREAARKRVPGSIQIVSIVLYLFDDVHPGHGGLGSPIALWGAGPYRHRRPCQHRPCRMTGEASLIRAYSPVLAPRHQFR